MARREAGFDLAAAARSAGFTPRAGDAADLVALVAGTGDEADAKAWTRALMQVPDAAADAALAALDGAVRPERGRIARLIARLAEATRREDLAEALYALTRDQDLKAAGTAIDALAALPGARTAAVLAALAAAGVRREQRRALVRALGQAGGEGAGAALAQVPDDGDAELVKLRQKALVIAQRDAARAAPARILGERRLAGEVRVAGVCRPGLEELVAGELRALGRVESVAPGRVTLAFSGALDDLWRVRTLERFCIVRPLAVGGDAAAALVEALAAPATRALLTGLTEGAVRYRLDWPQLSDAQLWELVRRLATAAPELANDPRESLWEIGVDVPGKRLELRPRGLPDPRFAYRRAYVPAASHPAVAAALAALGGVREDDVVWDPFCGSGMELIERARLGQARALVGTDLDADAVAAARANIEAAGFGGRVRIEQADALSFEGFDAGAPTLIVTNPPLGRRVHRGQAEPLMRAFMPRAAGMLAPGGRLVMTSPFPELTRALGQDAGLAITFARAVDLGGIPVDVQLFVKARP